MNREEDLIKVYQRAQQMLIQTIATKQARGNVIWYQESLLKQVRSILQQLNAYNATWVRDAINESYAIGAQQAISGLLKLGVTVHGVEAFSRIHTSSVEVLIANTQSMLFSGVSFVGRQIEDEIRRAGLEAIALKQATGQTVKETAKMLKQTLIDQGLKGIRDKRGRMISLDAYASTVARSTTREATNTATMNQLEGEGYDLVKMSKHNTTCPVCSVYQGRVYSISGKSTDYPALSVAFSGGYANIHPNCRHVVYPYIPTLADDPSGDKRFSNTSFNIDPRSKAAIDEYNARQKEQRQLRADRAQFQRYKLALGDDAPKSFAGFRKSKAANSERFIQMQNDYREFVRE